ncbi:uncharacterized protein ND-B17 [Venturia canescens]|uniref:uncharacterized protein ND-B17 n=1 Tax=Venturia canescens TaxID=32260 RepID=UPI001C9D665C|nr:uncharacterized protein LOC122409041 [Venturia canescens]XP_043272190.1 uncharacterized protein LOC122409041 [Venturia canescens]
MSEYNPPSETGGVRPMTIAGRMISERERLQGMSDVERAWRAQWLKDQILAPEEPVVPANYYEERYNVLRRFYMAPLNKVEAALRKPLGDTTAAFVRYAFGRTVLGVLIIWAGWYHLKYNRGDWTKKSSLKISMDRKCLFPSDKEYPHYTRYKDSDYGDFGFKDSPI